MDTYQHTQRAPLHLLLHALAVYMFFAAWQLRQELAASLVMLIAGLIVVGLALSFKTLTVADDGDELHLSFGPARLFGTRIRYDDITDVHVGRTSLIDGWGIHCIQFRGWTFNLWGFECVLVRRGRRTIRIGTDDSANLASFLRDRCGLDGS